MKVTFHNFASDRSGSVKLEFVLIFPVLVIWLIGSFVFFDAYKSYSRSAKASYAVADLASRQLTFGIGDLLELHDLLDGLVPWSNDQKWVRITSLEFVEDTSGNGGGDGSDGNANGGGDGNDDGGGTVFSGDDGPPVGDYEVLWSHASGINTSLTTETLTDALKAELPDSADGDTVILIETSVPYSPLIKSFGLNGLSWTSRIAIRPRYVMSIADASTP